jgi:hypothetical protein
MNPPVDASSGSDSRAHVSGWLELAEKAPPDAQALILEDGPEVPDMSSTTFSSQPWQVPEVTLPALPKFFSRYSQAGEMLVLLDELPMIYYSCGAFSKSP